MLLNLVDHLKSAMLCYIVVKSFVDIVGLSSEKILLQLDPTYFFFFPY